MRTENYMSTRGQNWIAGSQEDLGKLFLTGGITEYFKLADIGEHGGESEGVRTVATVSSQAVTIQPEHTISLTEHTMQEKGIQYSL